jgi:hypothetical protein
MSGSVTATAPQGRVAFICRANVQRIQRDFGAIWPRVQKDIAAGTLIVIEEVPA